LSANGRTVKFDGWLKVWGAYANFQDVILPLIQIKESLKLLNVNPEQKFTTPPPKYTEASFIKELEANNVGRPSTYANIISTILDREYVAKENKSFIPTQTGKEVAGFLEDCFCELMDIEFTANMENDLDKIADGILVWDETIGDFWQGLSLELKAAQKIIQEESITEFKCPKCNGILLLKNSPYTNLFGVNKFFSCENWKKNKKDRTCEYTIDAKSDEENNFIPVTETEKKKMQNRKKEEKVYLQKDGQLTQCPVCKKGNIIQRKRKKDKKTFWACDAYPQCKTVVDKDLTILGQKKKGK